MSSTDRAPVLAEAAAYAGIVAILSGAALAGYPSRLNPDAVLAAILAARLWGAGGAGALGHGDGLGWAIREQAIAAPAATLAVAAVLWRLDRRLPQQVAVLSTAVA